MELIDPKLMSQEIQNLIKNKVEQQCFLCMGQFDGGQYAPMMMCINQHSCCAPCMQELLKNDASKQISCPHCNQPLNKKSVTKNRYLITIIQLITAYNKYVGQLQNQLETLRKASTVDPRASLLTKHSKLVNSFILTSDRQDKILKESTLFDDIPTSRSQTWIGMT